MICLAKQGDRVAFTRLVKVYSRRVYSTAYSYVHDMDDASDIVQETFIRVFRHLAEFDEGRPFFPWIHRIARNLCLNFIRSRKKGEELADETPDERTLSPDEVLGRGEMKGKILACMNSLTAEHRRILDLKYFEDCSYAEMAEILGIPIGTVMSRLFNARLRLKQCLFKEGSEHDGM